MDEILRALSEQHAELDRLLAPLDAAAWARSTPCPGWTVADVVLHLAQTDELAAASAAGRLAEAAAERGWDAGEGTVDDAAGRAVELERGAPGAEVHERWRRATRATVEALAACAPGDRVPWVAGELAARTLATTRLAECWIHTGDVAAALGAPVPATARLWHIARLAHRTVPYALARAGVAAPGPVTFRLSSPVDPGEVWVFGDEDPAGGTVVEGPALDLCRVAGQRAVASETALRASGPDADAVLRLVRTFA